MMIALILALANENHSLWIKSRSCLKLTQFAMNIIGFMLKVNKTFEKTYILNFAYICNLHVKVPI